MAKYSNSGPLGSETNNPILDDGTLALTQFRPPWPLGLLDDTETLPTQLPVVRSLVLKEPPVFKQDDLTCWASAIASWLLVKKIVKAGFSDQYLIDYYKGTSCVDSDGALTGVDAIEGVFAEWRLGIDMEAKITQSEFDATKILQLLQNHGHFILSMAEGTMHAIVVYGIEVHQADDPFAYSLLVMDPIRGVIEKKHHIFIDYPVRIAVGLPKSGGPAPCRGTP